jgi:hypothetical protein
MGGELRRTIRPLFLLIHNDMSESRKLISKELFLYKKRGRLFPPEKKGGLLRDENRPVGREPFRGEERAARDRPVERKPAQNADPHRYGNPLMWTTGWALEPDCAVTTTSTL